jgi:hypothetical protein
MISIKFFFDKSAFSHSLPCFLVWSILFAFPEDYSPLLWGLVSPLSPIKTEASSSPFKCVILLSAPKMVTIGPFSFPEQKDAEWKL